MSKKILIVNYIILVILLCLNLTMFINNTFQTNTEEIYSKSISKVVEIRTTEDGVIYSYATGFFVNKNGTILTNKHVVYNNDTGKEYSTIEIRLASSNNWQHVEIEKISENSDLALIKSDEQEVSYFKFERKVKNGESIYTIGNPNGFGLSYTSGIVSSSVKNVIYNENNIKAIQTSFVINEGNSGGPVFNKNGKVIGIISFRLKDKQGNVIQGISFALPYETIKTFL